jgi:HEPN domain-containing protein
MSDPGDWRAWIAKAANGLLNIENNLQAATIPWDTVCFHAHQAAEKSLKALLISLGEAAPRMHDLAALLGLCSAAGASIEDLYEDCARLQPYAVLTRYPGSPFEPDAEESRLAADAARRVFDAAAKTLSS